MRWGDTGCRVGLRLEFEMAGKLLGSALALGFTGFADPPGRRFLSGCTRGICACRAEPMPAATPCQDVIKADLIKPDLIRIEVVYALPDQAWSAVLELPNGAIASEALAPAGFATRIPGFDVTLLSYAIFGRPVNATTVLRDGDRLELLRPLIADPQAGSAHAGAEERLVACNG